MTNSSASSLDRSDRRILRLLQADGRMTNAEVARRLNMSPAACHRRKRRLFAAGYTERVAGDFDYFVKIRIRDIADFNRIHSARLITLPGVRQTRTFFVIKEVIDGAPLDF